MTVTKKRKLTTNFIRLDSFLPFMTDTHRYNVLYGSAGSGKSAAAAQKVIRRCIEEYIGPDDPQGREPFHHIFTVVRKYKTTLRGTVFEQIKGEILRMGIAEMMTINESYGVFKFWNGAEIRCIGLDDPEKIKSLVSTGLAPLTGVSV